MHALRHLFTDTNNSILLKIMHSQAVSSPLPGVFPFQPHLLTFPFLVPLCVRGSVVNFHLSLWAFSQSLGVFYYLSSFTCPTGEGNVTTDTHKELGKPHAFLSHQLGSIGAGREVMAGCVLISVLTLCPGEVHLSGLQHYLEPSSDPSTPPTDGGIVCESVHSGWAGIAVSGSSNH